MSVYNEKVPTKDLTRRTKDNLIHVIEASVGSKMFQHIYVTDKVGREFDATDGGDKSCAYHTSGVLSLVGMIDRPHATVQTTLQKMEEAGWTETNAPTPGCVVLWPAGSGALEHTGFYLGDDKYVSNSSYEKVPVQHGKTMKDGRDPVKFFTHPALGSKNT